MRGDSLRDFYAKTLALLGLGVLAGAGALVDYWPVGLRFPQVAPALTLPAPVATFAARTESIPGPPAAAELPTRSAPALKQAAVPRMVDTLTPLPATASALASLGVAVALTDLAISVEPGVPQTDDTFDAAFVVASAAHDDRETYELPTHAVHQPTDYVISVEEDEEGFITGAFKKTGSSIVRTSVRTGASIVRVVGGVVRRALPN